MRKMKCSFCQKEIGHAKVCPFCGVVRAIASTVGHTKTHAPTKKGKNYAS